uniref:Uncharacterized protein n=1 Tax=Glossina morsitans morsitans TaxID=37546 RepID=A0A1B0G0B3_GLOMM
MTKHKRDINIDAKAMPMVNVAVPAQPNQTDCGVFLLRNLELYLGQRQADWDPLALPEAWCTVEDARRTRVAIAAALLELTGKEEGAQASPAGPDEKSNTGDDAAIVMPNEQRISIRAMTVVKRPLTIMRKEMSLDHIEPTVGLLGDEAPPARLELGDNAEWVSLEEEDPLCQYLRAKYSKVL